MPYSWCTTRSPSAISVASAMNWSARLRRRGGREMRVAEQVLLADQGQPVGPKGGDEAALEAERDQRHRAGRLAADRCPVVLLRHVGHAVLAQQVRQAFARAAGPGGDHQAAALVGPAFGLGAELVEHVGAGARRRPGRRSGRAGRRRRRRPRRRAWRTGENANSGPPASMASQPARSRYSSPGGSGRYGTSPSRGTLRAGGVMVGDHLQPRAQHVLGLVVEADRGAWQVVQQRLHPGVEQRHPVLHAGVAAAGGDRLV